MRERLLKVRELCKMRLFYVADKEIDAIYEEYISGETILTPQEENEMFALLEKVANGLYSRKH